MTSSCDGPLSSTCNSIRCHSARSSQQSITSDCSSQIRLQGVPVSYSDGHMIMLCCAVLCYAMLCCAVLCYAVLSNAVLWYTMLCYMLCCAMLCYAVLCYAMLCYAMLCYAMQGLLQQISRRYDPRRGESNLDSRAPLDSSNTGPRAVQLHPGHSAAEWTVPSKVGV